MLFHVSLQANSPVLKSHAAAEATRLARSYRLFVAPNVSSVSKNSPVSWAYRVKE